MPTAGAWDSATAPPEATHSRDFSSPNPEACVRYLHYAHKARIVNKLGNDTQRINEQILAKVCLACPPGFGPGARRGSGDPGGCAALVHSSGA